jgi:hypothetical protein
MDKGGWTLLAQRRVLPFSVDMTSGVSEHGQSLTVASLVFWKSAWVMNRFNTANYPVFAARLRPDIMPLCLRLGNTDHGMQRMVGRLSDSSPPCK